MNLMRLLQHCVVMHLTRSPGFGRVDEGLEFFAFVSSVLLTADLHRLSGPQSVAMLHAVACINLAF